MRLAAMFDFLLWSSWLTIKKLTLKIILFYRSSGGQITKNLVGRLFLKVIGPAARLFLPQRFKRSESDFFIILL